MIQEDEKLQRNRIRGAHVSTVCSIALVLFLIGIQTLILGYTRKISDYVKENIGFTVMIKDQTREQDILELKAVIDRSPYVKSTRYISSKEAAAELEADLGHDFIDFLGYNPLLPSIEVHLKAEYMQTDSVAHFEHEITRYHMVKEMFYQRDLVSIVNDNVRKISFWLMGFGALTLLIAVLLINNTMRLLIYSKRFTINTMQLVGATAGFIRKPFLLKSLAHGFAGACLAVLLLAAGLFYLHGKVPEVVSQTDLKMIGGVFVLLFALGLLITLISAYFSVNKYVRMRNSDRIYN